MKITKSKIKHIIKEEIRNLLLERVVMFHGEYTSAQVKRLVKRYVTPQRNKPYKVEGTYHFSEGGSISIALPKGDPPWKQRFPKDYGDEKASASIEGELPGIEEPLSETQSAYETMGDYLLGGDEEREAEIANRYGETLQMEQEVSRMLDDIKKMYISLPSIHKKAHDYSGVHERIKRIHSELTRKSEQGIQPRTYKTEI